MFQGKESVIPQTGYFYQQLQGDDLQKAREVYHMLYSAVRRHQKVFLLTWDEATEELMPRFLFLLLADHPEIFYASAEWTTFCYGQDFAEICFDYGFSKIESRKLERKLKWQVSRLVHAVRLVSREDKVQQMKYLYQYFATNISYAQKQLNSEKEKELYRIHSAVGALLDRNAVCDGIARGFKLVLDELGIENRLLRRCLKKNMEFDHEWNVIFLNGRELHIDITWEMDVYSVQKQVNFEFFLLSEEEMNEKHRRGKHQECFWKL